MKLKSEDNFLEEVVEIKHKNTISHKKIEIAVLENKDIKRNWKVSRNIKVV